MRSSHECRRMGHLAIQLYEIDVFLGARPPFAVRVMQLRIHRHRQTATQTSLLPRSSPQALPRSPPDGLQESHRKNPSKLDTEITSNRQLLTWTLWPPVLLRVYQVPTAANICVINGPQKQRQIERISIADTVSGAGTSRLSRPSSGLCRPSAVPD